MLTTMTNEILKLRTMRSPVLLLVAAQLLIAAGVSGLFVSGVDARDPQVALRAVAHAGLVSIFSLMLGIIAVAGEYRHRTITDTYLATPRRGRVVVAKVAVYGLAGVLFGTASAITATVVTAIWLSGKGASLDLGAAPLWRTLIGCVVWNAAFAAIGVGVGALVRNLAGAVAAALAWLAVIEGIAGQLIGDMARWLPVRSGLALEAVESASTELLPQWGGGLVLAGYAAAFVALAVSTTVRRDVS